MEAMGQRVYKPLLGVADTNHLLSIHIWVMLGNVEPLIQVRKWLRGLPDAVPHGHARHHGHDAHGGLRGPKLINVQTCTKVDVSFHE